MNSIEIFLHYYPEMRALIDPDHKYSNLKENEVVALNIVEQRLKEAR